MGCKGTKTEQNLLKAFAGESQARMRYTFFAEKAKEEGFEQIAALFLETAENEKEHAQRFFNFLDRGEGLEITAAYPAGLVGTTAENLKAAAAGENEEWSELYPEFAKVAEDEGFKDVATAFRLISKVEVEHEKRYLKLLENVEKDQVFKKEGKSRWKCRACGYVHEGTSSLKKCPVCLKSEAYFELKEGNY
ncbi:Rubrerythrin [Dethiosulfatibacter aminovorans DSM 17477]|uniref:Rubrerythrin n=1 Tax=Dethiosulfatibacter aminovorans DSM 17477 TaxID=1121476 RepID=A0A1M6F134_9FIRM|nr:ferritin family protein [Dethiosulfatibacter aminovorans]SHI91444.1 Rubrerythrin [Dethiosulfatibacter aminovorans DSM 17477]